jgi:hypothetical protein
MVVVVVRDGQVPDRLAGEKLFDLVDRLAGSAVAAGRFHHEDVIL